MNHAVRKSDPDGVSRFSHPVFSLFYETGPFLSVRIPGIHLGPALWACLMYTGAVCVSCCSFLLWLILSDLVHQGGEHQVRLCSDGS